MTTNTPTPETKTYEGGCHCKAVRYRVTMKLEQVTACNCSICSKMGWLLAFAPGDGFELLTSPDALGDYQFAKKHIHHLFCKTCGVNSFGWGNAKDGSKMYAINVRCLDDVDAEALPVQRFDGKSL